MLLDDRFLAGPAEMVDPLWHLENAPGRKRLALADIQLVAEPHVERARNHGHLDGMPVWRDPVVGGKLQAEGKWTGLTGRPFDQRHACGGK